VFVTFWGELAMSHRVRSFAGAGAALVMSSAAVLFASVCASGLVSCDGGSSTTDGGNVPDGTTPPVDGQATDTGSSNDAGDAGATDGGDPNCSVTPCMARVVAGLEHACALSQAGTVYCWGNNLGGQVGTGPGGLVDGGGIDTKSAGLQVMGLGVAKAITAGYYHSCALLADGTVWCWGDNSKGQLGQSADGGAQAPAPAPKQVMGLPMGITQVEAGGWHTCVLAGGNVTCWGLNASGQIGTGTGNDSGVTPLVVSTPTQVANLTGATDLGLGDQLTCALTGSGPTCLGTNSFGQLGRGGDAGQPPFATAPGAVTGAAATPSELAKATGFHQCLLAPSGAQCWGRNGLAQLGTGSVSAPISTPQTVTGLAMPQEIAPGGNHTCARLQNGNIQCWGGNIHGQAGQMAIDDAGITAPTNVQGITNALQITSGWGDFSCAVVKGGTVWCWGGNFSGQLGRGGNAPQSDYVPARVVF
jgi:alpha-tubulin suppressor-like RCC1 family protein